MLAYECVCVCGLAIWEPEWWLARGPGGEPWVSVACPSADARLWRL